MAPNPKTSKIGSISIFQWFARSVFNSIKLCV